jgi:hypothetical protein
MGRFRLRIVVLAAGEARTRRPSSSLHRHFGPDRGPLGRDPGRSSCGATLVVAVGFVSATATLIVAGLASALVLAALDESIAAFVRRGLVLTHGFDVQGADSTGALQARETTSVRAETEYARSGDVNVAYQVIGDLPFDLVFVPGYVTHLEVQLPTFVPFLEELASFSRLIRFDKRGTGMSDRVSGAPTLETRMDDVPVVAASSINSRSVLQASDLVSWVSMKGHLAYFRSMAMEFVQSQPRP